MFIADDPLLACIVRFVLSFDRSDAGNEEFLGVQIKTLKRHLLQFPTEEHDTRAMDWVVQHAADYRRYWQRRTISERTWSLRCEDCPIAERSADEPCEIHEQWLYLLRRYMLGDIRSRDYVERALALLQANKDALICRRKPLLTEGTRPDGPRAKKSIKSATKTKKKGGKKKRKSYAKHKKDTARV
ncbi:MAG: hypothetical protein WBG92_16020 [Thiohalocapsa sp.]